MVLVVQDRTTILKCESQQELMLGIENQEISRRPVFHTDPAKAHLRSVMGIRDACESIGRRSYEEVLYVYVVCYLWISFIHSKLK